MKRALLLLFCIFGVFSNVHGEVETKLSGALNDTKITYVYSGGMSFKVKFEKAGASYRGLSTPKPEQWHGPFPYKVLVKENGEYFVAWFEEKSLDYVTLVFNLNTKILYGSALIGGKYTHFEKAEISKIEQ